MKGANFFDTNILVYAYYNHFPDKQQRAQENIISAVRNARDIIKYMGRMTVQEIDLLIVERALDTLEQYKIVIKPLCFASISTPISPVYRNPK